MKGAHELPIEGAAEYLPKMLHKNTHQVGTIILTEHQVEDESCLGLRIQSPESPRF